MKYDHFEGTKEKACVPDAETNREEQTELKVP
jgi:hypothetical protein